MNIWYVVFVPFLIWIIGFRLSAHHCILFLFIFCTASQVFWKQGCTCTGLDVLNIFNCAISEHLDIGQHMHMSIYWNTWTWCMKYLWNGLNICVKFLYLHKYQTYMEILQTSHIFWKNICKCIYAQAHCFCEYMLILKLMFATYYKKVGTGQFKTGNLVKCSKTF